MDDYYDESFISYDGWRECWQCGGEGLYGHDCGDDCCCCLNPEENMICDICDGEGGWKDE